MLGILLLSHGHMAEGMLDSCKLFFGEDVAQIEALCLLEGDDPEAYDEKIKAAIERVDDGHGVVAFCDLLGGTPSNRCAFSFVNDRFQVITGMNFTALLELLGMRGAVEDIKDLDINALIETGKSGMVSLNSMFDKQ